MFGPILIRFLLRHVTHTRRLDKPRNRSRVSSRQKSGFLFIGNRCTPRNSISVFVFEIVGGAKISVRNFKVVSAVIDIMCPVNLTCFNAIYRAFAMRPTFRKRKISSVTLRRNEKQKN